MLPFPPTDGTVTGTIRFVAVRAEPVRLLEYNPKRLVAWIAVASTANAPPCVARTPAALQPDAYPYVGNTSLLWFWGPEELWGATGISGPNQVADVFIHEVFRV